MTTTKQQITSSESLLNEVKELVKQVKSEIDRATDIDPGTKEEVSVQVTAVERQIKKDKPSLSIIGKSLELIESLLLDAASSEFAPMILEGIRRIVPLVVN